LLRENKLIEHMLIPSQIIDETTRVLRAWEDFFKAQTREHGAWGLCFRG